MATTELFQDIKPGSYVRERPLCAALAIAPMTAKRWVLAGKMPAPVRLGPRTKVWQIDEIREWLAKSKAQA